MVECLGKALILPRSDVAFVGSNLNGSICTCKFCGKSFSLSKNMKRDTQEKAVFYQLCFFLGYFSSLLDILSCHQYDSTFNSVKPNPAAFSNLLTLYIKLFTSLTTWPLSFSKRLFVSY